MAITNNGTQNLLDADRLPTGYTVPSITTFTDYQYTRTMTLTVLKSTVENATEATTMTNIFDNGTIGLDKQIDDILAADWLASATVTAYANLRSLSTNYYSLASDGDYLNDTAVSYTCIIDLFVKAE